MKKSKMKPVTNDVNTKKAIHRDPPKGSALADARYAIKELVNFHAKSSFGSTDFSGLARDLHCYFEKMSHAIKKCRLDHMPEVMNKQRQIDLLEGYVETLKTKNRELNVRLKRRRELRLHGTVQDFLEDLSRIVEANR